MYTYIPTTGNHILHLIVYIYNRNSNDMKKLLPIIALSLFACSSMEKSTQLFQSEKLVGIYDVDMSPVMEELQPKDDDDGWTKFGKGLANMALANIHMTMKFYPGNKCDMEFSGNLFDWFQAPSDSSDNPITTFAYRVEQDSILYMKGEDDTEFTKWGIVRRFNEDYSKLQFLVFQDDDQEKKVLFNLNERR